MNTIWTRKLHQAFSTNGSRKRPSVTKIEPQALLSHANPLAFALEPRFMFDAAGAATAADAATQDAANTAADAADSSAHDSIAGAADVRAADPTALGGRQEVAFVMDNVTDYQDLVAGLADGVAVVVLDNNSDALSAMASWLQEHQGYDAVHILSHGAEGQISLGTTTLNLDTLESNASALYSMGQTLSADADIMLYGCDVSSDNGMSFVNALATITGADIAASDDATGDAARGGDWELESTTGTIDSTIAITAAAQESYSGLLVSPSSQTFDSETGSQASGYGYTSLTTGLGSATTISWADSKGWTYTINNSTSDTKNWNFILNAGNGYSPSAPLGNNALGIEASLYAEQTFDYFTFSSTDGSEFKLNSFYLMADATTGTNESGTTPFTAIITGYMNGSAVSGATKSIAVADVDSNALTLVDVSADTDFNNVDQIRIELSGNGITQLWLDAISISAAVAANAAPTITASAAVDLGAVNEDANSSGTTVASILTSASYGDTDGTTNKGIAVYGTSGTGTWQYTTDSGSTWYSFGAVSSSSALLLDSSTQVRYMPEGTNAETATLSFKGWDKTSGSASSGSTANHGDTSSSGGTTAFSTNNGTASISVTAVNDAPTISNGGTATLTAIDEGTTSSGTLLSSLMTGLGYADVDTGYSSGFAVTGKTGTGTWQYSTDNSTWADVGTVSASSALLLTSSSYVRFISTANNAETATLTVKGWDTTAGSASTNSTANHGDTSSSGGTTAYSTNNATISQAVTGVNDAPTITNGATATLTGTTENTASSGTTVSSILTSASYADVDTGASSGIAITATSGNGTWQYTTDGTNWFSMGTVSSSAALLLTSTSQVRYTPDSSNGETATFSFKAWDQASGSATSGASKGTADTTTSGGASAFSTNSSTASLAVSSLNDAPTVTNGSSATLTAINEGATASGTQLSSLLTSFSYADVDTGYSSGLAITGKTGTGTWQYSTDNSTWADVGTVSASSALLLTSSSYVRFISTANNAETATLTVKGWDTTAGSASTNSTANHGDTSSSGGTTAYSTNNATISQAVTSVNDAPTITNGATATLTGTTEDAVSSATTVSTILSAVSYADVDTGASSGIAVTALSGSGTWQYSTDGTNWYSMGTVSSSAALLLTSTSQVRYSPNSPNGETATFTFKAWDQSAGSPTSGSTKGTADTATTGGTSAFSASTSTASIAVSSVNDAPTITSGHVATLTTTDENTTSSATTVSSMLTAAGLADVDTGAVSGIAVTGVTGNGTWQYSTDGTNWTAFGTVSATSALLLSSSASYRYVPDSANGETATFTYKAWDQSSGSASTNGSPSTANTSTSGGTSAFSSNSASASLSVSSVNDAPTVSGSVTTTAINDNSGANTLFGGLVIGDVDTGATVTVTVTVNTAAAGALSGGGFVSQGGGVYTLTGVSAAAATTALDSLAFTPTNNVASSGSTSTTFTIDVNDGTTNASTTSSALTVNRVNDAPDIGTTTPSLGSTPNNRAKSAQISTWLTATDNDSGDSVGIAISAVSEATGGGTGVWAYSTDGGTNWTTISGVSASASLLLRSSDYLRYTPGGTGEDPNSATVTYRTWDGTTGTAGSTADTTTNGGTTAFSSASTTGSLSVADVNDAPTITANASVTLTGMTEDATSSGTAVSSILASASYADVDTGAVSGLAITAKTGNGTWQYSTDGTTWTAFGTVSATSALLLTSTTQVRYVGDAANGETATFSFKAWDQTSDSASANGTPRTGDTTSTGGETAYSTNNGTASLTVTSVNDAPTITNGASATLTATDENTTSTSKTVASMLVAAGIGDIDQGALSGIAVTAATGNGTWQFSTDNSTWTSFGTVSTTSALLLSSTGYVRYVPDSANGETATLTFKGWDQSSGTASSNGSPQTANATSTGGTTAFSTSNASLSITVSSVNDAPVMTTTTTINATPITEDATSSATPVSAIVAASDVDTGASVGIAITSVVGNGTLQYSLDGTTWHQVGAVSESSALLLAPTAQLRSVADGKNGETATFTFRAWDQSSGTNATKVDTSTNGGTSAFSTATRTVSQTVTSINDAPSLTNGTTVTLTGTTENTTSSDHTVASLLSSAGWADVDTGASSGIAITGLTANGTWQYSTDGVSWTTIGTVSSTSALLLSSTTKLHYVPDNANGETASITFKAWDQSTGTASTNGSPQTANTASSGGTSAFSTDSAAAELTVSGVNDAPVMTVVTDIRPTAITEDQTSAPLTVSSLVTATDADTGAAAVGIAIYAAAGNGTLQYSLDGTTWHAVGPVSSTSALLLGPTAQVRYVGDAINGETASFTYKAWDQSSGTQGTKVDASASGGATAFSTANRVVYQDVTAVNDAPTANNPTLPPLTSMVGQRTTFVLPANTFTDVDSTLTYSATLPGGAPLPSWATFDPTTRTLTVTGTVIGSFQVVFSATDGIATPSTSTLDFKVTPAPLSAEGPPRGGPPPQMPQQALMGLRQSPLTTDPVGGLLNTIPGLGATNAPIAYALSTAPASFGLSTAQSGPIPTAVTGTLGSSSQLDNTGTPVNAGLAEARDQNRDGRFGQGSGQAFGGQDFGQQVPGQGTPDQGAAEQGGAPNNGPQDNGAQDNGPQANGGQRPLSNTTADASPTQGDDVQAAESGMASALPFSRQLSGLSTSVVGRHGALMDALNAHTLPSNAA